MLRGTKREQQGKSVPCYDATAGKRSAQSYKMHTNVVSTPAKPNKASRLARNGKKTHMNHERKEKIHMN